MEENFAYPFLDSLEDDVKSLLLQVHSLVLCNINIFQDCEHSLLYFLKTNKRHHFVDRRYRIIAEVVALLDSLPILPRTGELDTKRSFLSATIRGRDVLLVYALPLAMPRHLVVAASDAYQMGWGAEAALGNKIQVSADQ